MDRDFKGVWISKDIWLNEDLTALDKVIYAEIDSLDNEDGCWASNLYMATFCGCSESKVSKTVAKLKDMGLITVENFDGRHRIIRVVKNATLGSKKCYPPSQNLRPINIANNIEDNIDTISINANSIDEGLHNFDFGKQTKKPKKENLYDKCLALINDFTDDLILQSYLTEFLKRCLTNSKESGVPFYTNTFRGKLNKLKVLAEDNYVQRDIVTQTLNNGWNGFYELKKDKVYNKDVANEFGVVKSEVYTEDELRQQKQWRADMERNGKQVKF